MTTTTWNTNAGDGVWTTPGNWDNGLPDPTIDAVVTGAGAADITGFTNECKTLDMSAFTGAVAANSRVFAYGSVTLGASMTGGVLSISYQASGSLTTNGFSNLNVDASSGAYVLTLTQDTSILGSFGLQLASGSTLAQGAHTITSASYISVNDSGPITYSAGAKWIFTGSGDHFILTTATSAPPVEVLDGNMQTFGAVVASYLQLAGTLTRATGTLTVTGDFSFTGTAMTAVQVGTLAIDVGGTAVAHDATIQYADFSGGTALDATDGCTSLGSNTDVLFGPVVVNSAATAGAGSVTAVFMGTDPQAIVLTGPGQFRVTSDADWAYNSEALGTIDMNIPTTRALRFTVRINETLTFYAKTATTGTMYILRER